MPFQIIEDVASYHRGQDDIFVDKNGNRELKEEWDYEYEPEEAFDSEYLREKLGAMVPITPSEFTEFAIMMPDKETNSYKRFSFEKRGYLRQIYDTPSKNVLLKCGRQVEKSTMLGNKLLSYSCINTAMNALYVSPTNMQAKVFSQDRLKEPIETSPYLKSWTTTKLSDNVFLKKFVNRSQVTLRYAYLNADRCLVGSTRVQLTNGEWIPIRDLRDHTSFGIIGMNNRFEPIADIAARVKSGGIRSVVEVQTDYPIPLRCTPDHKILTARGMTEAQHLREGDYIAAPHAGSLVGDLATVDENTAWLIGAMTAEGECSDPRSVRFSNTDEEFIREFIERAHEAGVKTGQIVPDLRYQTPCYSVSLYSDERGPGLNGGKATLWSVGEFGYKAHEKKIPRAVWLASVPVKAAFLQPLFRGDGSCHNEGGYGRSEYSTSSRHLAEDLCHLLWSLGIRTSLREKPPSTDNALGSYVINFSAYESTKLIQLIGEYRPGLKYRDEAGKSIKDRIPISYDWLRSYLRTRYDLSTHTAWVSHQIQLRPGNRRDSIGRRVLLDIALKLNDDYLRSLASASTSWVEVKRVTPCPEKEEVFDIVNAGSFANFLADGLIVSNCRGIPADVICLDELQDLLTDNIPVIEECASHSELLINGENHKGGLFIYSGTPKSLDNTIEYYWANYSTQNEWVVPCHRHTITLNGGSTSKIYWNILSEDHLGPESLVCDRCQKPIDAADPMAQWVAMNPEIIKKIPRPYEGYRIPQLMVPWIGHADLIQKQRTYPRVKFYNEVLGLSYDSGTRPLTRQDVVDNCDDRLLLTPKYQEDLLEFIGGAYPIYAGIDWGSGEKTYTVFTMGTYLGEGKFTLFYAHRFEGRESEPEYQIEEISRLINKYRIQLVGCDYGGGFWPNDELTRRFGWQRIVKYQYSMPSTKVIWQDGLKRFLVHRTEVMSDIFNAIKRRDVFRFPNWDSFQHPFGDDMLNIFSEYNEQIRQNVYKKSPNTTDDTFHALVNMFLVSMLRHPRPDVIAPTASTGGKGSKEKTEN